MFFRAPIPFVSSLSVQEERDWLIALSKALPEEAVLPLEKLSAAERAMADVAIVANPDPTMLSTLPNLVWVQSVWAGVEKLVSALKDQGSPLIARLIDPELSNTMAEAVLAWVLYLHRDMPVYWRQQQDINWQPQPYIPARERTIGLLGMGQLGKAAAARLQENGFSVMGWRKQPATEQLGIPCYSGTDGLKEVLGQADILVVLLPLTAETSGLLDLQTLQQLRPGTRIINFARGPIIDEDALLMLMNTGHIAHAVLDVFSYEPLPRSHPFWHHPNITVLPHISAPTSRHSAAQIVANNITTYRHLRMLPETVDYSRGY